MFNKIYRYSFVHDNAKPHIASPAKEFIANFINIEHQHPPNSPDLNPIEKVWALLKDNVYEGEAKVYDSVPKLRDSISKEWEKIEQSKIQKYINNLFTKRLDACIENDGDYF